MNKSNLIEFIKQIKIENLNKEELNKLIKLHEFLMNETIINTIEKKIKTLEIEKQFEFKERIKSIEQSLKTRQYTEKITLENTIIYNYDNHTKIYIKNWNNNENIWEKILKNLEKYKNINIHYMGKKYQVNKENLKIELKNDILITGEN